ncbi:MAG: hypothetical protein ABIU54_14330 [Candidatus Eisenbacteria bacterium]
MRLRPLMLLLSLSLVAPRVFASGGEKPPRMPGASIATSEPGANGVALTSRQQAEQWYADAYDDIAKGKQEVRDGKAKNAEKRFRRALERSMRATEYDSTYHEAWNLAGFAARKLGDYPTSLAAYRTSIRLKGDYAPAHEYYGQALAESGDLTGAQEQLVWLQKLVATDLATQLQLSIDAKRPAAPAAPAAGAQH